MVLVAQTGDPVRFSYLTAMLRGAGIEFTVNDDSVGQYRSTVVGYQLFVSEADSFRAKALVDDIAAPGEGANGATANSRQPFTAIDSGPLRGWRLTPTSWRGWVLAIFAAAVVAIFAAVLWLNYG